MLSGDFPALKKYLGENNFYFFARKHLKENGINSPSIQEVSKSFKTYMIDSYDVHNDDLVEDLAKIDLMWSHGFPLQTEVSKGALEYWQEIMFDKKSEKVIDLSAQIKLTLINYNGCLLYTSPSPRDS